MTLVIMAAGMGSRFGGLKQIEPINDNNEFIIDYSIFDAIRYSFDKVVFIIKEENYDIFKNTIGKRVEEYIKVEYVFQDNSILPKEVREKREKPLGTAHAILCAKDKVHDNFAVINADDFYGKDAFYKISEFLRENKDENLFSVVAYNVENTITKNGSVKRGICHVKNGCLTEIIECSISESNDKYLATPLDGSTPFEVEGYEIVSMNFFGFTPKLFDYLNTELDVFLKTKDLYKDEFLLPDVVCKKIKSNDVKVQILTTTSVWHGMTYKEELIFSSFFDIIT